MDPILKQFKFVQSVTNEHGTVSVGDTGMHYGRQVYIHSIKSQVAKDQRRIKGIYLKTGYAIGFSIKEYKKEVKPL